MKTTRHVARGAPTFTLLAGGTLAADRVQEQALRVVEDKKMKQDSRNIGEDLAKFVRLWLTGKDLG